MELYTNVLFLDSFVFVTSYVYAKGYRLEMAKAPLREDIVYALVQSCLGDKGVRQESVIHKNLFKPNIIIIDPFCGSGTIAIEAAAYMMNLLPGRLRPSPLRGTTLHDPTLWEEIIRRRDQQQGPRDLSDSSLRILASDRDEGAIQVAKRNAKRAGIDHLIEFQSFSVSDAFTSVLSLLDSLPEYEPRYVYVITNPPYGRRIGGGNTTNTRHNDLLPLYQTLGKYVNQIKDAKLGLIAHDITLARQTAVPNMKVQFATIHGGLSVVCLVSEGPSRSE